MFREMMKTKQLLSQEKAEEIMARCTGGVLACQGDDGYPYAVPISFVYDKGRIYFHSAKKGHKMDAILNDPKVSLAVIDEDTIVSEEYTSYFRSAIAFGKARICEGEEYISGFQALVEKYSGDRPEQEKAKEIRECQAALIVAIDVEHLSGKEAIELVKQ